MKLRIQTDYALRTLILLAHSKRKMTATEIADTYLISKDHLVKIIQQLSRLGYVRASPGRGGGVVLTQDAAAISVHDVIKAMEGATGILDCVNDSTFLPNGTRLSASTSVNAGGIGFLRGIRNRLDRGFDPRSQKGWTR